MVKLDPFQRNALYIIKMRKTQAREQIYSVFLQEYCG